MGGLEFHQLLGICLNSGPLATPGPGGHRLIIFARRAGRVSHSFTKSCGQDRVGAGTWFIHLQGGR
jgi:hypothetical protein